MHEYGHAIQSHAWGPLYLFAIALPSAISNWTSKQLDGYPKGFTNHKFRWYEISANKNAAKYFGKYYGVDWSAYDDVNPRRFYFPHRNIPRIPGRGGRRTNN